MLLRSVKTARFRGGTLEKQAWIWAVFILTILVVAPTLERVEYGRSLQGLRTASTFNANLQGHAPIVIISNTGFSSANGVTGGSGKVGDPYIIAGWQIDASSGNGITIVNTTSYFTVQGVNILSGVRAIYLDNATNGIIQRSVISNSSIVCNPNPLCIVPLYGILIAHSKNISVLNNIIANSGSGSDSEGIELDDSLGVSVVGNRISSISEGLYLTSSPGTIMSNNTIWFDTSGVSLFHTPNAIIMNNNISYSRFEGISLSYSPYAHITGNVLSYNNIGVNLVGSNSCPCPSPNATLANNVVDWNSADGIKIADNTTVINNSLSFNGGAGIAVSGENTTISSNTISFNGQGGIINYGYAATIENNTLTDDGLSLSPLDHRQAMLHPITQDNLINGKPLYFYEGCSNLNINAAIVGQLILMNCRNIQVTNVEVSHTFIGVEALNVSYITITNSSFNSNTRAGIYIFSSSNVTIIGNDLSNNNFDGLGAPDWPLTVYHNNFFFDDATGGGNVPGIWDDGYPSGGNYWSAYNGVDNCSGPQQNICPNPDGIGDTSFHLYPCCNDADPYPLMKPYLPKPDTSPPTWLPNVSVRVTGIGQNKVTLFWIPAADDVAVIRYEVYQGTAQIATVPSSPFNSAYLPVPGYTYTVHNLTPNTAYNFTIVALDAGNNSASSPMVTIKTQPQTTPPGLTGSVTSLILQYWYLWVLVGGGIGAAIIVFLKRRPRKRSVAQLA